MATQNKLRTSIPKKNVKIGYVGYIRAVWKVLVECFELFSFFYSVCRQHERFLLRHGKYLHWLCIRWEVYCVYFFFFLIQIILHVYPFEPDSAFTNEKDNNTGMSHSIRDRVWGWGWGYIGTSSSVLDIITTLILGSV